MNPAETPSGAQRDGPWLDQLEADSNLTRSQYMMWAGQTLNPADPLYNMMFAVRLRGPLDERAFVEAWRSVVANNAIMRTVIEDRAGIPWRIVKDDLTPALERVDLSGDPDPEHACRTWIDERRVRALDPGGRLTESALLRLDHDDHLWFLNQHHVVTDAWSVTLLRRRLADAYAAALAGEALPGERDAGYDAYADSERASRRASRAAGLRAYWREQLQTTADEARFYGRRREGPGGRTERVALRIDPERVARMRALAESPALRGLSADLGLSNLLFTATAVFMHRLTGNRRIAIGMPVHNRARRRDRQTMGLFMEMLPLFVEVRPDDTLASVGENVRAATIAALGHGAAGVSTPESNDAYDVVLNVLPMKMTSFEGLRSETEWVHSGHGDPHHTLRIQVHDFEDTGTLHLDFDFDVQLFPAAWRDLALEQFDRVIDAMLTDMTQTTGRVAFDSETERRRRVGEFNATDRSLTVASIDTLIRGRAAETPQAPAVVCDDQVLTYGDLDTQADRLARRLLETGVMPGQLVPIHMERSAAAVVAILATLRAGAAYVPLDPRHPAARQTAIVTDIRQSGRGAPLLLTDREDLRIGELETLHVPTALTRTDAAPSGELPRIGADDLAYVIYTSGSTGRPKGTLIQHRSLLNYVTWAARHYDVGPGSRFALHSSLAVDLTVTSVFVPLITGGCIVAYPDHAEHDVPILKVFEEDAVDIVKMTPAHLTLIRELDGRSRRIRTLILGGEDLKTGLVRSVAERFPTEARFFNEYGPTEATVGCMIHRYDAADDTDVSVPIGRPIDNTRIYLLDDALAPAATGLVGEICIGGAGVAAGYLSAEGASPFVADPFESGATLYRTGDLGRWTVDDRLEFLGRADSQLKIRGARVELGEIEAALASHDAVTAAAVVAQPGTTPDDVRLAAFYVADRPMDEDEMRDHLAGLLPEEMRPARLRRMETMPLTMAGKTDYRALAGMEQASTEPAADAAPRTDTEKALARIWCELLDLPGVRRSDSFFDLGGTSLGVLQLGARIRADFSVELPLERLFDGPTVEELGAIIETLIIEQIENMSEEQAESLTRDLV